MRCETVGNKYSPPLYLLFFFYGFAAFVSVLLAPSLPAVTRAFHVSASQAEWVMSVFLIGYALAQLVFGPISNHYGRKPAALIGVTLALAGSIMQIAAFELVNFELLIWGRLVNAFGAASGLVLAMTMVTDVHQGHESRRVMATLTLMQAFFPGVAIFIGGSLTHWFGLRASFYFLALFNMLVLGCVCRLKETLPAAQHQRVHPGRVMTGYMHALSQSGYLSHVILVCVASASIYVFNSFAPLVALRYAEIDPQQFGALNFITSVGLFIGAVIVRRLSHKHAGERFLRIGMWLIVTAGLVMAGLFEHSMITVFTIFIPAFALFVGIALVLPNASMMALAGADNSALSAGLLSFLSLLTGATAVFISGTYIGEHALALPLTLIITAALGMLGSRMTKGVT